MSKTLDNSIRKDNYMRIRLTDSFLLEIQGLAKKRGVSLSDLVRQTLQKELDNERNESK